MRTLPKRAPNGRQRRFQRRCAQTIRACQDGEWHNWPDRDIKRATLDSYAGRINRGDPRMLGPGYQAAVRAGILRIRKAPTDE